jgi:hypothetical protein
MTKKETAKTTTKKEKETEQSETPEEPILPDGAGNPVIDGVSVPREEFEGK